MRAHRVLLLVFAIGVPLVLVTALPAQDLVATLQAQFLERFTRFIEWPAGSTVSDASQPFVIGVLGQSPVYDALSGMAETTKVKGKRLEVRRLASPSQAASCQVVFVSSGDREGFRETVATVAGQPVLVVADSRGYARQGAMINFLTEGEYVRFEINPRAAEANGLRFASELLALGEVVD